MNETIILSHRKVKLSTKCRKCSVLTLNYLEPNIFAKKTKQNKMTQSWILYKNRAPTLRAVTSDCLLEMLCNK